MVFRTPGIALLLAGVVLVQLPAVSAAAAEAVNAPGGVSYEQMAGKTTELAAAADVAELATHLQRLKTDSDLDDAAREKLLRRTLLIMADIQPDDNARNTVRALRSYPSKTYVWRDEHGHREKELLYDVAAAARFAEKRWNENASFRNASAQLNTGGHGVVTAYVNASKDDRTGVEKAFRSANLSALERHKAELITSMRSGDAAGPLSLIVASRLDDAELYRAVLENADGATALDAIAEIQLVAADTVALSLLEIAAARPDIRSAALLAIGRQVNRSPAAEDVLFSKLGHEGGASAAAALARTADPAVVDRLAQVLNNDSAEMERRHALLGLRLAPGERATRHLRMFESDPRSPQELVKEVR
jgi:hypothetical protein